MSQQSALADSDMSCQYVAVRIEAIGQAVCKQAVDPALEDGRHAKPPKRKLEDHGVGGEQIPLLGCDVCGLPSVGVGMPGLFNEGQALGVSAGREVVFIEHGLPVHAIQVRQQDFVPLLLKRLHAHLDEPAGQRCRFGVRMDDQNLLLLH